MLSKNHVESVSKVLKKEVTGVKPQKLVFVMDEQTYHLDDESDDEENVTLVNSENPSNKNVYEYLHLTVLRMNDLNVPVFLDKGSQLSVFTEMCKKMGLFPTSDNW
jgi:flagellar biosynthesis/type III secretory pathway M-ring protein FliF/YscJ